MIPSFEPIRPINISDNVYEAIEVALVRGEMPPGTVLSDRQLAHAFGISRTPVRDALHRLEASGLVERRGRTGWVVASFDQQDVRELFQLRRLLEPLGMAELFETRNEELLREFSTFFDGFTEEMSGHSMAEYLRRDREFHIRLVELSGNARALQFYTVIEKQIDRIRHYLSYGQEGRVRASLEEHRRIHIGIGARDRRLATLALLDHLHNVEQLMIATLTASKSEG